MIKSTLNNYLFYKEYLKNRNIDNKDILVAKTRESYIIGPLINERFDEKSFYKRIVSNSVFSPKIYKRLSKRKCLNLLNEYQDKLKDNEVIEIFKNNEIIIHKIIKVPGDNYEK